MDDNYPQDIFESNKVGKSEKGRFLIIKTEASFRGDMVELVNADTIKSTNIPLEDAVGDFAETICYTKYNGYISGMGMKTSGEENDTSVNTKVK